MPDAAVDAGRADGRGVRTDARVAPATGPGEWVAAATAPVARVVATGRALAAPLTAWPTPCDPIADEAPELEDATGAGEGEGVEDGPWMDEPGGADEAASGNIRPPRWITKPNAMIDEQTRIMIATRVARGIRAKPARFPDSST